MKSFNAVVRMVAVSVLMGLAGSVAAQQAYPNKPIRLIVPFPPGGTNNLLARLVGQKLTESWGQPVIVDNRPGANTNIGAEALAKSHPDGYTIMLNSSVTIINPLLYTKLPYDPIKDFAPVSTTTKSEQVLAVNPSVPVKNLQEFIAFAKSKPGQLNHASVGTGSVNHLVLELFNVVTGVKIQDVPYKGGGPLITDLIGGQVQLAFQSPIAVVAHIKTGKLKGLAVSGPTRLAALPDMPTFAEAGLTDFDVKYWHGVFAPARTPTDIVNKLSAEIAKIMLMPDIRESLLSTGLDPFTTSPAQFAALMKADMAKYGRIIKTANIKIED